jgi:hypothetical protein
MLWLLLKVNRTLQQRIRVSGWCTGKAYSCIVALDPIASIHSPLWVIRFVKKRRKKWEIGGEEGLALQER